MISMCGAGTRAGSSPHTRGARQGPAHAGDDYGIIPAYAGSTTKTFSPPRAARDHPRIRGEHYPDWQQNYSKLGSSPHTRGAPVHAGERLREGRIIPAYAGSTSVPEAPPRAFPDHPRIRGEHLCGAGGRRTGPLDHPRIRGEHVIPSRNVNGVTGSSPHTRGAPRSSGCTGCRTRIIPAYAGSTQLALIKPGDLVGSSPHTRGAPASSSNACARRRIIPAYAGSTSSNTALCHRVSGSSPHTRGALNTNARNAQTERIIPAYAGSTRRHARRRRRHRDHPRIRGEHDCSIYFTNFPTGSSPHTRGALQCAGIRLGERSGSSPHTRGARERCESNVAGGGIIPAYAGSTGSR